MIYKIAKLLRDEISGLNFVEIAAGLAQPKTIRNPDLTDEPTVIDRIIPVAYNDLGIICEGGDLYALIPDTQKMSVTWWESSGLDLVEEQTYYYQARAVLNFVGWWNLPLIDQSLTDPSLLVANIIATVPTKLDNIDYLTQIRVSFEGENPDPVGFLNKYTFDEPENQFNTYPYFVSVLNFSVDFAFAKNCVDEIILNPATC